MDIGEGVGGQMAGGQGTGVVRRSGAVIECLRLALAAEGSALAQDEACLLPDMGGACDCIRLRAQGVLVRIPKTNRTRLPAAELLAHQVTCFERIAASGHGPRLVRVLAPSEPLPSGALIIEEGLGRPARLPDDLPAIAVALACIHRVPVAVAETQPPKRADADALPGLLEEISDQSGYLDGAGLAPESLAPIRQELALLHRSLHWADPPPTRLIAFETHPGNFLIRDDGSAVLIDPDKARRGFPPLDLAQATLFSSITWDGTSQAELRVDQTAGFYRHWAVVFGRDAYAYRNWLIPLRRAMWLWSVTWCAKWRVLSQRRPSELPEDDDWAHNRNATGLIAHVRNRVDLSLAPHIVARARKELAILEELLT